MATCAKCGATLPSEGVSFCSACGGPVVAAAPTAAPPPVIGIPPAHGYAMAQPRSGNTVLKVVLIVIAVVVGLGVLGVAGAGFIGYRALHSAGASFSGGSSAQLSTEDLGIDPYPGAAHVDKGSMRASFGGNSVVTSVFTSNDSSADVVKFYEDKLGTAGIVQQNSRGTTLERASQNGGNGDSLLVTVSPDDQTGQTKIVIVHTHAVHQQ